MTDLISRIISHAPRLSGQQFKLLIIMASNVRNNPPEYMSGWELLEEAMGWDSGTASAHEACRRKIAALVKLGYLRRTQHGGISYAAYEITIPPAEQLAA